MLVPHEGHQIFSLQLNWVMIFLLATLLLGIVSLAAFSLYEKYKYSHEKEQLIQLYGNKLKNTIKLEALSKKNKKAYQNLLGKLETLALDLDIPQREINLLRAQERLQAKVVKAAKITETAKIRNLKTNISLRSDVLPPIHILKSLYSQAQSQMPLLSKVHNWYSYAFGVYQAMPLGRPFKSFQTLRDTSGFGKRVNPISRSGYEFHNGYDTAGPLGTPVYATGPGTVHKSYHHPNGYGRTVIIEHRFGLYSAYAHLSALHVRTGAQVKRGQRIGSMGSSGRVTGVHLHYEIHKGFSQRINPRHFICAADFYTNSCLRYHNP